MVCLEQAFNFKDTTVNCNNYEERYKMALEAIITICDLSSYNENTSIIGGIAEKALKQVER